MSDTIGAFEAKTHLSSLLDRVEQGEHITITRHGIAVAELVPIQSASRAEEVRATIENIKLGRQGRRLGDLSLRDLIKEGRR